MSDLRQRYSFFFVLAVLGIFLYVMLNSLAGGVDGFEANLSGRKPLIAAFNGLRYSLGDRVFPQVLVGRDGFMEYTSDGNLDDYQNVYISRESLAAIHQKLILLNLDLKSQGVILVVVVAPNKASIYPDELPDGLLKLATQSRLDVFMEMAQQPNAPIFVDVRPSLKQAQADQYLYFKTDTHWTPYGAYFAYQAVMDSLSPAYADLRPRAQADFSFHETDPVTMEMPRLMGVDFLPEPKIIVEPDFPTSAYYQRFPPLSTFSMSWANDGQDKTLLMYHDSFGYAMMDFLKYDFKQAMYIRNNSEDNSSSSMDWFNIVQPDVVVIEIVERNLPYLDTLLSNTIAVVSVKANP